MLNILGVNVPVSSVQIHQQYIFWPPEMGLESIIKKGKIHSVHYLWSYSHKCLLIDTINEQKNTTELSNVKSVNKFLKFYW